MALGSTSRCRRYTFLASMIVTQGFNVYQKEPESVTDLHNDRWPSLSFRIHNRRCYKNASSCSVSYTVHTIHNGSPWTFHLAGLLDSISFHGTKVCNTHLEVDMLAMDVSTIFMCIAFCPQHGIKLLSVTCHYSRNIGFWVLFGMTDQLILSLPTVQPLFTGLAAGDALPLALPPSFASLSLPSKIYLLFLFYSQ